ncbi:uncharacterized protein LOC119597807 [Penaeus monodon]|uniref:uncharacterized protein LOC119597807 n=1 Tax=Penaeus monodon TaxID=6687 RepID=UPI0018A6DA94|nr:uncharacterized protein LOC119597807 [Penaeus monodon]
MFSVESFVDNPSAEALSGLTKAQWSELAAHYCIPIRSSLRKDEIRTLVTDYLLEHNVLSADDLELLCPRDVTMARQYDLESRKLDLEMFKAENERMRLMQRPNQERYPHFRVEDAIKFVPKFNETEPEYFFIHFERVAALHGWPEDKWVLLVHSAFVGRAQEVFSALDLVQSQNYYVVKETVLNVYKKVPEAYRQDFRNCRKDGKQTFVEFIRQKQLLCKKWVESELDALEYDKLLELFILEDIKKCMPVKVRSHIDERGLRTLAEVGSAADHFALTNPNYYCRSNEPSFPSNQHNSKRMEYSTRRTDLPDTHRTVNAKSETGGESRNIASRGFISADESCTSSSPVTILRDSAADISLVLKEAVPNPDCYTGEMVIINGLIGSKSIPICEVYLKSDLISGYVRLGVVDRIPSDGISFLMGNDLVGDKVWPCPVVFLFPAKENNTVDLEREYPDLFPACAVTRSASRRTSPPIEALTTGTTLSDESPCDVITEEFTLADFFDSSAKVSSKCTSDNSDIVNFKGTPVTKEKLIEEQTKDPDLKVFYERLTEISELENSHTCYYLQSGVLMRKYKPYNISADDTSKTVHQIVIPKSLQIDVLNIAHDISGHLGVKKTYYKILAHFYWPKMKRDVSSYCQSCHICQVKGKPGAGIKPYPLQPIPVLREPFSKVVIDCVGPLPKTKRGNKFLLTIIDVATRYPEAFPLRRITTKNVVKALIKFFTQVGLPTVVQSDQGSNFTSRLYDQVMKSLGIQQCRSSVYHPQSQGVLERFHYTLKTMIKAFCLETGSEWDEGIDLLLFSVRDSVQESLGYSPFQLIYGHEVRGPLKVLKECWLNEEEEIPMAAYVNKFKHRLQTAISIAHNHLSKAQAKMKEQFDKVHNTEERSFNKGDLVLALLPLANQPLQSRYAGPFRILKRTSDVNYVIETPKRRKKQRHVHVNLLKMYYERGDLKENMENVRGFHANIGSLLQEYGKLFSDVPRLCPLLEHDVETRDAQPVRQAPYRLNAEKRAFLQAEVQRLKEQGIIIPSLSPWASPVVLVPKSSGTYRLCVDYRKVNAVTVADSFPLPRMDDIIDDLGKARYLTKLDLLQGYYQVPLTERARPISAFVTPTGLYEFRVLPFGMRNAPATFQRLMNYLTADLEGVRCYLDDLVIWSDSWEEHLVRLRALFSALSAANLTVNLQKSEFGHAHVTFLGHVIGQGLVAPVAAKVEAVLQYPAPVDRKGLMRFMGMAGYYRRFCKNFSQVSAPLTNLLSTKRAFRWSDDCQQAFENLKHLLCTAPVLQAPDINKPFAIQVDASDNGVGAVLLQRDGSKVLRPVCYFSYKYKTYQKSYATVEKEALGIVLAIEKFRIYLTSSIHPLEIFTDHNPLTFIENVKFRNMRVLRWALTLQPFNIKFFHISGRHNILADALSRS